MVSGLVTIVRSQPEAGLEPLGMAWSRPLERGVALSVSPEGERVLAADAAGQVRCYDGRGSLLWERRFEGVDSLATGRRGGRTLAYTTRHPLFRRVFFLNDAGESLGAPELPAPIESAVVSPDGKFAVVVADRLAVFYSRGPKGLRHRTVSLPEVPGQMQLGPGDSIYVTCEKARCVMRVKSNRKVLWRRPLRKTALRTISASEDGRLLAIGTDEPADQVGVRLIDSNNRERWALTRPGRAARVRLSPAGTAVLLAYEHKVEHEERSRFERRLTYLRVTGNGEWVEETWTKGGAYTAPMYVSVARDGEWVVALDAQQPGAFGVRRHNFRLYGRGGERRWIYSSSQAILLATASLNGRHIATYRADDVVELVRVSAL